MVTMKEINKRYSWELILSGGTDILMTTSSCYCPEPHIENAQKYTHLLFFF